MGGYGGVGGPPVWAGGAAGMPNLGTLSAMGVPVHPGPEAQQILGQFGQQVPEHLQQTQLFGGLEQNHPRLAGMLEAGIMGAAMTPSAHPGMPEGAGGGISRALQGVIGAHQSERQFQIAQIMAPYALAKQTAELRGAAQEEEARKAQIEEMRQRGKYFGAMADLTPAEARIKAAEMGLQGKEDQIKQYQQKAALVSKDYEDRTAAMAKHWQMASETSERVAVLRKQATLGSAKMRADAVQQFTKYAAQADEQLKTAIKNRDEISKQIKDLGNNMSFLIADENAPIKKQYNDLQGKLQDAQSEVETVTEMNRKYGEGLTDMAALGHHTTTSTTTTPPPATAGTVRLRAPNGQEKDVPAADAAAYIARGAKQLK